MIWKKTMLTVHHGGPELFPLPDDLSTEPETEELITLIQNVDHEWGIELTHTQANTLRHFLAAEVKGKPFLPTALEDQYELIAGDVEVEGSPEEGWHVVIGSFFFDVTLTEASELLAVLNEL